MGWGNVELRLTGADIYRTLAQLQAEGIQLEELVWKDALELKCLAKKQDLQRIRKICHNRGDVLSIRHLFGPERILALLWKRPVLVLGMALLLFLSLWLPGRVLFVLVEGNTTIPHGLITEKAANCGLYMGLPTKEIRSQKIQNALLQQIPQLQWAGINCKGCVAVISVRERKIEDPVPEQSEVSSIVAVTDARVEAITVERGMAKCKPGELVQAGQVLISGFSDHGLCVRAEKAKGEVYGQTQRQISLIVPAEGTQRGKILASGKNFRLIFGKIQINFHNSSGILGGECVRIYSEQYIKLPGGFVLPIGIGVECWTRYETEQIPWQLPEAFLSDQARLYLQREMIAGEILSAQEDLLREDGRCRLVGNYTCYEMIGRVRPEECLLEHENYGTSG